MSRKTSLSTSKEYEWIKDTKKSKPWYSKPGFSVFSILALSLIDTGGFVQGVISNLPDNLNRIKVEEVVVIVLVRIVMILGFIAAFEFATLYMAYAFSLKLYHYDRYAIKRINFDTKNVKTSKFISTTSLGWISFVAFLLGVIANIILRFGIMGNASFFDKATHKITFDGATTIVMMILPIVTSILNFVIGCFTFDPLLYELNHLAKEINKIKISIDDLEKQKININYEINKTEELIQSQESIYKSNVIRVISMRPALRARIYEETLNNA